MSHAPGCPINGCHGTCRLPLVPVGEHLEARAELDAAIVGARDAAIANEAAQKRFHAALDAYVRLVAPVPAPG